MDSTSSEWIHPCVKCGACCGTYRVLFDSSELTDEAYKVPKELTEKVEGTTRVMMGTSIRPLRCIALGGHIGKSVGCTIYSNRPSCCREFKASFEDGQRNPRCDEARRGKGMRPLGPRDYEILRFAQDDVAQDDELVAVSAFEEQTVFDSDVGNDDRL